MLDILYGTLAVCCILCAMILIFTKTLCFVVEMVKSTMSEEEEK